MSGFSRRQLGKTGLQVSPLGIGGGGGIQADDLLYAFEQGINYFFYSSDLHHFTYSKSVPALRQLCARGSSTREQVVLATVSYIDDPDKLLGAVLDQFEELGVDYIDVFHWGWITNKYDISALVHAVQGLKANGEATKQYCHLRAMQDQAQEASDDLIRRGLVRYVGMSFHSRQAAVRAMSDVDVMMLRYNIARPQMGHAVFSRLSGNKQRDPGIVAFNAAHEGFLYFHVPPSHYPAELPVPTAPDCYRFALSNPWVDIVLTGVSDRSQIDQALEGIAKGPLEAEDYEFLKEYGALFADEAGRRMARLAPLSS